MRYLLVILAMIALLLLCSGIACLLERRDFNNGVCRRCGTKLTHFDNDSQGGRGYACRTCGYSTWVSYDIVDRGFEEDW